MKPLAELLTKDYISFEVHSVTGEGADEIAPDCYIDGPEKYSKKFESVSAVSFGSQNFQSGFWCGMPL